MMTVTTTADLLLRKNQQLTNISQEIGALRFESMLATRETLTLQQKHKFRDFIQLHLEQ